MRLAIRKPCASPGCSALVENGRCSAHQQAQERWRGTSTSRGYDAAWRKLRAVKVAANPLCEDCLERHVVKATEEVHHIITVRERPDLRLDFDNLRSLCKPCHSRRTMTETMGG